MGSDRNHHSDSFILAERLLSNLPGVISAKINSDLNGEIVEIHLLTDNNKSPKQIVRDVESALFSGFDIEVDHKRISVAQLRQPGKDKIDTKDFQPRRAEPGKNDRPVSVGNDTRLRFDRFEVVPSGDLKCRAEVILVNEKQIYRGTCEDTNTAINQMKISSKAVLSALEEYLHGEKAFTLEELKVVEEIDNPVVMVVIGVISRNSSTSLVGTTFIGKDQNRAAALATLKALNRFLGSS
jgi:hypothetical protein